MKKRNRKYTDYRIAQIVAALAFVAISLGQVAYRYYNRNKIEIVQAQNTEKLNARFLYIHDGDTAVFSVDGQEVICRFLAVDCPEIDQEGYEAANSFTKKKLSSAYKIVLEIDPHSERYDKFDRLLAWVWVDDQLLQAKLIESGHATIRYLYENYLYTEYLYRIQNKVQKDK
ncbi:MAG: thermonuclease family protein [Erysipelotrichaceae bacterium]|nr:thermonuclease family protein [Erysipelotrichaceae bacterium]MBR5754888.1 thermonuclease family protein [Erysipelotrichaceae bacterium]